MVKEKESEEMTGNKVSKLGEWKEVVLPRKKKNQTRHLNRLIRSERGDEVLNKSNKLEVEEIEVIADDLSLISVSDNLTEEIGIEINNMSLTHSKIEMVGSELASSTVTATNSVYHNNGFACQEIGEGNVSSNNSNHINDKVTNFCNTDNGNINNFVNCETTSKIGNNVNEIIAEEEQYTDKVKESVTPKSSKPLNEIRELFFQEKPVQIIEQVKPEKVAPKKTKQKTKSKRAFLSDSRKKYSQCDPSATEKTTNGAISWNLPLLVFQPFGGVLQKKEQEERNQDFDRLIVPNMGLSVMGTKQQLAACPIEEELVMKHLIEKRQRTEVGPAVSRQVIMIREEKSLGNPNVIQKTDLMQEVPGPRLQYTQGRRAGPLGVTRKVVPPLSLVRRLSMC